MPATLIQGCKPLRDSVEEVEAVACQDRAGMIYWVRVFRPLIARRAGQSEPLMETPNGLPVYRLQSGRHLIYSPRLKDWVIATPVQ